MKLLRIGERGAERPAVLDDSGVPRAVSGVTGDFGPAFFAGGGLAQVAAALAGDGLPELGGRVGAPVARPGKVVCMSQYMVREPCDLVNTGTPAGVALGLPDHPYLRAGDQVRLEIDGLGHAEQQFVAAP
jgi:hypothetical protein